MTDRLISSCWPLILRWFLVTVAYHNHSVTSFKTNQVFCVSCTLIANRRANSTPIWTNDCLRGADFQKGSELRTVTSGSVYAGVGGSEQFSFSAFLSVNWSVFVLLFPVTYLRILSCRHGQVEQADMDTYWHKWPTIQQRFWKHSEINTTSCVWGTKPPRVEAYLQQLMWLQQWNVFMKTVKNQTHYQPRLCNFKHWEPAVHFTYHNDTNIGKVK
jgi:hypothetical protein